jgi:hypothetical protein
MDTCSDLLGLQLEVLLLAPKTAVRKNIAQILMKFCGLPSLFARYYNSRLLKRLRDNFYFY